MRAKITKKLVNGLEANQTVTDTEIHGFRIRVGKHKIYSVQKRVGKKVVTRTIGRHGVYTLDSARREAQQILLQLSQGQDPLEAARKQALTRELTFGKLVDLYEAKLGNPNTRRDVEKKVRGRLSGWLRLPANEITRTMVSDTYRELRKSGPTQAALIMRYVRAIFNYGIAHFRDDRTGESPIFQNPTKILTDKKELPQTPRRGTFIKSSDLKEWYEAVGKVRGDFPVAADYVLVTLLLGCRKTESASLKWADVNLEDKKVIFRNTKNKTDHHLPIGNFLANLLKQRRKVVSEDEEFVFPAKSRRGYITEPRPAIEQISKLSGVSFIMSDLRRTFATVAEGLDFSPYSIKRLLNHALQSANDVTAGYIGNDVERQRGRMQQVEDFILKSAEVIETPVIPLATGKIQKPIWQL